MCSQETIEDSKEIILATARRMTRSKGGSRKTICAISGKSRIFGLKWK